MSDETERAMQKIVKDGCLAAWNTGKKTGILSAASLAYDQSLAYADQKEETLTRAFLSFARALRAEAK
jgi:hypothetical protein